MLWPHVPSEDDKHTYTREYFGSDAGVLDGRRSAEKFSLGHITKAAGNDIERATDIGANRSANGA